MRRSIQTIYALFFSPCGSTREIVMHVAGLLSRQWALPVEIIDFTQPDLRSKSNRLSENDFLLVGFPTYAGRLPNKIAPLLRERLQGRDTPAAMIVTYGNRGFDNSLAEMKSVLSKRGFRPLAAAACVAEHVFTERLAAGRPSAEDFDELSDFAGQLAEICRRASFEDTVEVPGDPEAPYYTPLDEEGRPARFLKSKPKTDMRRCTSCGRCAEVCPMASVHPRDFERVEGICIKCQACIKLCPEKAKSFDDKDFLSHVKMLEEHFQEPKTNQFFFVETKETI